MSKDYNAAIVHNLYRKPVILHEHKFSVRTAKSWITNILVGTLEFL